MRQIHLIFLSIEINLNLLAVISMGFSVPICMLLVPATGVPQLGQEGALSDISLPHSGQLINAIINLLFFIYEDLNRTRSGPELKFFA